MATRARRTSSKVITYEVINHFAGGITAQEDKVQIPKTMSPMARNVEWRQQGGFVVRKGAGALLYGDAGLEMQPVGKIPVRFFHYVKDPTATTAFVSQYLVAVDDGTIRVGVDTGPALGFPAGYWLHMQSGGVDIVTLGSPAFAAWDTNVYLSVGTQATNGVGLHMQRWDGATATALGTAYVDDYAAPTGGNMPCARYLAAWQERMWVGCCLPQSGPIEGNTVRWSHPGRPEDYATGDYINVGQSGDVITGIAPMRDMLVIFKRSSTYALLGSGTSNFRVIEVSGTIGSTGEWTRDNQGAIVFWDATLGACRFDGKGVTNIFEPLVNFIRSGASGSITRCGGVVTDGERIYVATDFQDFYGARVPGGPTVVADPLTAPLIPGQTTWGNLVTGGVTWAATSGFRWLSAVSQFADIVWVYRPGAGWTSFSFPHPSAPAITMLGQLRSRPGVTGSVQSARRIVFGLNSATVPIYLTERYDNGRDWWTQNNQLAIDAFYMTPWLHGGLPAQIKRFKAPRIIQEADVIGNLLVDVFYDFNYDFLRRTLKVGVFAPLSFDSYSVGKPGTIGRAKAVMLVLRPEDPHHWGVSSITIPIHPKVMR